MARLEGRTCGEDLRARLEGKACGQDLRADLYNGRTFSANSADVVIRFSSSERMR
jgi:hypothetical protein